MLNIFDRKLEILDGFETEYVKILYYDLPKNYSGEYRTYNYSRFCTIINGHKNVTLNDNRKFKYNKDNYLLLPPNSKVHMDMYVNTTALVFELNNELIYEVLRKTQFSNVAINDLKLTKNFFLGENKFDISKDIESIFNASISNESNNEFLIDLYAQKLVFDLIKNKSALNILKDGSSNPINIAIKYIDENIHSIINIKELANELYMSESNFSHSFKKIVGEKPVEYIKNKKLQVALEYLKTENVTEVAYGLGYANISYFIKLFKDKYKITPKQYQLNIYNSN
ncbi:helix-turn-helix transcriptional regulator [Clostridium grantii]|uniref:Transcriptional regulator, AraC family n=1 Tax=Clostridium grantii DSM 8605 TaxID=1121316 RepID=A0A1M5VDY2_9CLOT|nr:AraC family transcriptional regulator [Clostridium grantii]SHH73482.1 transcriptional regulator, AraC family [Clostridium grantii DSM 8605]